MLFTYVLLRMSMAQRQRITDDSRVQMPKVRAWSPFTVQRREVAHGDHAQPRLPPPNPAGTAGGSRARKQSLGRGPQDGPRSTAGRRLPGLEAAVTALTEAGAGGVQLLREEAVVAEALQGVPGGDDRHHHQPAAQHVQEPAHPAGRYETCLHEPSPRYRPQLSARRHPLLQPPPPASTPAGCGLSTPPARRSDTRASTANRRPRRRQRFPPLFSLVAPATREEVEAAAAAKRLRVRLACCACAIGGGHRLPVVVVTGERRVGLWLPGSRVGFAGRVAGWGERVRGAAGAAVSG